MDLNELETRIDELHCRVARGDGDASDRARYRLDLTVLTEEYRIMLAIDGKKLPVHLELMQQAIMDYYQGR